MAADSRQHLMTEGLVVREYNTLTEADRFVAILTRDKGIVRASARGAKKMQSRSGAATQLLCFSRLSLIPGRDKYIIEDARPERVFFELRQDMDKLALGQYFCELALALAPEGSPAPEHLRLLLNALYFLTEGSRDPTLVKAVVEGRLLCLEGYMPDLTGCCHCGRSTAPLWFSPAAGTLTCAACAPSATSVELPADMLAALRHILCGPFNKCFAFSLPPEGCRRLTALTERFLLEQLQRSFKTLDFYHSLQSQE